MISKINIFNIILFLIIIFIYFFYSPNPKIEGCTDINASNFDVNATHMKDSSCIILNYKNINDRNYSSVDVSIDNNRYSNIIYEFIYPSPSDTLKKIKRGNLGWGGHKYWEHTIIKSDTIKISINNKGLSKHKLYKGDNIKVIETVNNYSNTYFINIDNSKNIKTHLINPRARNRYKTERVGYSLYDLFGEEPQIKRYNSKFYNKIDNTINYWFEDLPYSISVDSRYKGTTYRTNIIRY